MVTATETSVLLDTLAGSPAESVVSSHALLAAGKAGKLLISAVCYGELAYRFELKRDLDRYLANLGINVSHVDVEVAFLAGHFYRDYKHRGGTRDRILPDFLIAAHAQLRADRLLTRDTRFFGQSFPRLKAVAPTDL